MTKIANEVSAFAAFRGSSDILKRQKKKISKKSLMKNKKLSKTEAIKFEDEYSQIAKFLNMKKKSLWNPSPSKPNTPEKTKHKSPKMTPESSKKAKKDKKALVSKVIKEKKVPKKEFTPNSSEAKKNKKALISKVIKEEKVPNKESIPHSSESSSSKKKSKKRPLEHNGGPSVKKNGVEPITVTPSPISVRKASRKSDDSRVLGNETFSWMIHPHPIKDFFDKVFEEKPLYIPRKENRSYYKDILSTKSFDEILHNQRVIFGKNLDVTTFVNDQRENHAPEGRAYPSIVWDFYNNGCSLRLLNPQTFHDKVWKLCSTLQECMGSMVGANMYLTPPGTQGFAPHYDDVEVFILQLEGKKHWRVYEPRTKLPRFSSPNFSQSEMEEPLLDIVLEAGDLLYMPRGTIHQGNCLEDAHSLHITISCHQRSTYGDLIGKILTDTLETAMEEDEDFRRGLPRDCFDYAGAIHSDRETPERKKFMSTMSKLFGKLLEHAPIDDGVDKMAAEFLHSSLPPVLSANEAKRSVEDGGEKWNGGKARVVNRVEFEPDTEIRLLRANCLRIVRGDESLQLFYNVENTREYKQVEAQFLVIEEDSAEAIEQMIVSYPNYVKVEDLPLEDDAQKYTLIQNLWERKLIVTKEPLEAQYDD